MAVSIEDMNVGPFVDDFPLCHASELEGDAQLAVANKDSGYCGSCYGGVPPASGCCNTCEDVRQAYIRKGWSFSNPDGIAQVGLLPLKHVSSSLIGPAQCLDEGWTAKIEEQNSEGCQISGHIKVNKVRYSSAEDREALHVLFAVIGHRQFPLQPRSSIPNQPSIIPRPGPLLERQEPP